MRHGEGQILGILQLCQAPNVARTTFRMARETVISEEWSFWFRLAALAAAPSLVKRKNYFFRKV